MLRSRNNGISGEYIRLYAFFYKFGELAEPSSIGDVKIYNQSNEFVDSIVASDISSLGAGIKKIDYFIPENSPTGEYEDKWTSVITDPGDSLANVSFSFFVRDAAWFGRDTFIFQNYDLSVDLIQEVKLYEKKWLKFSINDANNYLPNTDKVDIMFKDHGGSNLVYVSTVTINDRLNAYYFFNSSKLKVDYPDYIDRDNYYDWILKIYYNDQVFLPKPIQFKFSFD